MLKGDDLHIFAMAWLQMFGEFGGSGVTIGLVISILVFLKNVKITVQSQVSH